MNADDRLLVADAPIHEARHELVTLGIDAMLGSGLGNTIRELSVAQEVIRSDSDLLRSGERSARWIVPVDVILPDVDTVVLEDLPELSSTGGHHDVRRTSRRKLCSIHVGVVEEAHVIHDHALLGCILALQHPGTVGDAGVLLDYGITGARRDVISVRPDRRTRIIGKERTREFVSIVGTEWTRRGAHRVTHRITAAVGRRPRAWTTPLRAFRRKLGRACLRRLIQLHSLARLSWLSLLAQIRRFSRVGSHRFHRTARQTGEDRHDYQPAICELIVAYDSIAVVVRLARTAKSLEDVVRLDRPVQHLARRVEQCALLGIDRHPRIDELNDVIAPNSETVVGGTAHHGISLRS